MWAAGETWSGGDGEARGTGEHVEARDWGRRCSAGRGATGECTGRDVTAEEGGPRGSQGRGATGEPGTREHGGTRDGAPPGTRDGGPGVSPERGNPGVPPAGKHVGTLKRICIVLKKLSFLDRP